MISCPAAGDAGSVSPEGRAEITAVPPVNPVVTFTASPSVTFARSTVTFDVGFAATVNGFVSAAAVGLPAGSVAVMLKVYVAGVALLTTANPRW